MGQVLRVRDTAAAVRYFLLASKGGHAAAARTLAFLLLSGIGVSSLLPSSSTTTTSQQILAAKPMGSLRRTGANPTFKSDLGNAALEALTVETIEGRQVVVSATALALGLLHVAAVRGDSQAQLALALRYKEGE